MAHTPLTIILLGEPAAGKATQAALVLKKYHLYDLDMGKELRKLQTAHSPLAQALHKTIDQGKLAPTHIVRQLLHDRIVAIPKQKGILFDGTPKMLGEAKLVAGWLKQQKRDKPLVLYLTIPLSESVKRASNRKVYTRGKWSKRPDDSITAIKNRVRYYRTSIAAVVQFFKLRFSYRKISGVGTIAEVHGRIIEAIKEFQARTAHE